jgi:hypothetical protein
MRREKRQVGANQPFCGSGTSALTAGVSDQEQADCTDDGAAGEKVHAIAPDEAAKAPQAAAAANEAKPAPKVKSRSARSRRFPSFLRDVDLFRPYRR